MRILNSRLLAFMGLCGLVIITGGTACAASAPMGTATGFKVSPVIDEITVNKGSTVTETIYVTNVDKNVAVIAEPIVNDFTASTDESGQPEVMFKGGSSPVDSFKSIVKPVSSVTIQPGQVAPVYVVISIPKNAESGGYYGIVRFVSGYGNSNGGNLSLSASVGTLFLVTVPGNLVESLQPVTFSAADNGSTGHLFINAKKLSVISRLKNTGNIHVAPFGLVTISHGSKVIEQYQFNDSVPRGNILPDSIRKFTDSLKNTNWSGKYTIAAYLGYGTEGNLLTLKTTFWVIPTWFLVLAIIVILAVIIGGYYVFRRYKTMKAHTGKVRH